jgi:hypothetical protein
LLLAPESAADILVSIGLIAIEKPFTHSFGTHSLPGTILSIDLLEDSGLQPSQ